MNALLQAVITHWQALGIGSGVLGVAVVSTMPEKIPATAQDCWTWIREALQTSIPAARRHENPTQAAQPQQPK